jgi:hypothetical protein
MELIWLGEESMYCLVCPEFNLNISTGMRRACTESGIA